MKLTIHFVLLNLILLYSPLNSQEILSFRETSQIAKLRSPVLLAEKSQILSARGDLITAGILPNPVFNQMNLFRDGSGSGASYLSSKNRQDWYQITQTIPVAGQRRFGIEYAQKKLEVAKQDYRDMERNVVYGILSSWIDIWLGKNTLNLLENGKKIAEELVSINELRLKNQAITQSELQRTKILRDQYFVDSEKIRAELDAALRTMLALLAKDQEEKEFLLGDFGSEILPEAIKSEELSIEYALMNRPDLKSAQGNEKASSSKLKLEEANAYPQPQIGVIANPQNGEGYYGASVTLPIPVFDRNQGEVEKARADLTNSIYKRDAIERQTRIDAKNAFQLLVTAKRNRESYKKTLESAEQVLTTVRYSYTHGGTTLVDFLNAQEQWFATRRNFLILDANSKKSYLNLLYSTGMIDEFDQNNIK